MAGSYNRIILVGNLTRDPELRYVASGSAVTKFSLAINRRSKGNDETMYVDCVAWDSGNYKLADICNTYLKKGMSVLVEGRLSIRSYETKEGEKRKATEVVCDNMQMLDSKGRANGEPGGSYGGGRSAGVPAGSSSGSGSFDEEAMGDDEIPF